MNKSVNVFAKGRVFWSKIVGDQALVPNYDGDGKEWSFEFEPEDSTFLKDNRLLDRLKDPLAYSLRLEERGEPEKAKIAAEQAEGRQDYIMLRKPELDRDGNKNEPFRIYDEDNQPWDDRLIGNGSKVDVKLSIVDWGPGKKKSIYAKAIRVTDLVPYVSNEFAGMDGPSSLPTVRAKPAKAKPKIAETVGDILDALDDELPSM